MSCEELSGRMRAGDRRTRRRESKTTPSDLDGDSSDTQPIHKQSKSAHDRELSQADVICPEQNQYRTKHFTTKDVHSKGVRGEYGNTEAIAFIAEAWPDLNTDAQHTILQIVSDSTREP